MDWLILALRFAHVVMGALWVGMMAFTVAFLMPAVRDAGAAGATVTAGLERRRFMLVMPALALGTIVSGIILMQRIYGGMVALHASPTGLALGLGAAASIIAFVLGVAVMRPAMSRASALTRSLESVTDGPGRAERVAEAERLRARGALVGRLVTLLLVFAAGTMAVARYVA